MGLPGDLCLTADLEIYRVSSPPECAHMHTRTQISRSCYLYETAALRSAAAGHLARGPASARHTPGAGLGCLIRRTHRCSNTSRHRQNQKRPGVHTHCRSSMYLQAPCNSQHLTGLKPAETWVPGLDAIPARWDPDILQQWRARRV